jgi:REP element-mobilizing transposase RayT
MDRTARIARPFGYAAPMQILHPKYSATCHNTRRRPTSRVFHEQDYALYLDALQDAAATNNCLIHAYVLMTNHVHLLVTPG